MEENQETANWFEGDLSFDTQNESCVTHQLKDKIIITRHKKNNANIPSVVMIFLEISSSQSPFLWYEPMDIDAISHLQVDFFLSIDTFIQLVSVATQKDHQNQYQWCFDVR